MARVSFGSRAGSSTDYLVGNADHTYRHATLNGSYTSIEELTRALVTELDAGAQSAIPECTTCELALRLTANLPLLRPIIGPYAENGAHDLPAEFKTSFAKLGGEDGSGPNVPHASVETVLAASGDGRSSVQRAASRGIIQAIENVDGFKYSFNNAWAAKDEEGLRFSYICQDSMQNKDRHANGFTKTQKHLKSGIERGVRKATYDCKGSVSVKFSYARKCVDVYYRHYAIHATVAERKPLARASPRGPPKQRRSLPAAPQPMYQQDTGGLLSTLQSEGSAYAAPAQTYQPTMHATNANVPGSIKRKRDQAAMPYSSDQAKPLSLVDLLKQSEDAQQVPNASDTPPKPDVSYVAPPVSYDLPAWQNPPQPVQAGRRAQAPARKAPNPVPFASPYPPPYQTPQRGQPPAAPAPAMASQQRNNGPPARIPNAQGLFATLKPIARANGSTLQPHYMTPNSARAKTSCQNCRMSKKKVRLRIAKRCRQRREDLVLIAYSATKCGRCACPALRAANTNAHTRVGETIAGRTHSNLSRNRNRSRNHHCNHSPLLLPCNSITLRRPHSNPARS